MRVAVIGPTNVARVGGAAGIDPDAYTRAAAAVGRLLAAAGAELIVVPDRGVAIAAMDAYLACGGPWLTGLCPSSGVSEPAAAVAVREHRDRCHEIVDDLSWYEQHHRIGVLSDRMVCVGLSCGTLAELAWTKWTPGPPVALVRGTMSSVPPEMLAEIPATVLDLAELPDWLGLPEASPGAQAAQDARAAQDAPAAPDARSAEPVL
jgi:hypothetical protein